MKHITLNHSDKVSNEEFRVTFVHAPDRGYADTQQYGAKFMPVWAYTLASHITETSHFRLSLHDCRFQKEHEIPEADVFLFSGINQDLSNLQRVRSDLKIRFPEVPSIIGGPICWSFNQAESLELLEGFDHIFIGDGEDEIEGILDVIRQGAVLQGILRAKKRFPISDAVPFYRPMLDSTIERYYGAVLEVSRGCPFLCEFCDIRVMENNNRAHNKSSELIIEELDHLCKLGVNQVLLACDNFIGDLNWAEEVIDKIIEWQDKTSYRPALYTWLTVNLYKSKSLMMKMRRAGFDMLFIGVESFNHNSLLETAKVQNSVLDMVSVLREIQSYGFIIVAGLIFGFDSDEEDCFDLTLKGLKDAALLSGDPSLLEALPGTPLYRRIKLAGRLREEADFGLGSYKYHTNIKYLMPRNSLVEGYMGFIKNFTDGKYQLERLKSYFNLLKEKNNFVPLDTKGYGNLGLFFKMIITNKAAFIQMCQRIGRFLSVPKNILFLLIGLYYTLKNRKIKGVLGYFQFWLFAWTNAILKYKHLSDIDFDIDSVDKNFDIMNILPKGYESTADELIPKQKIHAQARVTKKMLKNVINNRLKSKAHEV